MYRIKSYVRRTNRLNQRQAQVWDQLGPQYFWRFPPIVTIDHKLSGAGSIEIDAASTLTVSRFSTIDILEIGVGNGENIVYAAEKYPNCQFLGLEVYRPGLANTLLKLKHKPLQNLKLMDIDAIDALEHFAVHSLREIWIYFPDPWPKKRHHKRRLINSGFLELCSKTLRPAGIMRIATDWLDYAEQIIEVFEQFPVFKPVEMARNRQVTKFEQRAIEAGRIVTELTYELLDV
ncbi:MAG: tRNA (guanosine(46)-N7)-methyltransferase TrmB [Bifidobacteriaceae bacterium]|nr:tRNA (guanosine(46)-N7)-methyltransferase TrmB [Bifidobacteriaceae bacterium]